MRAGDIYRHRQVAGNQLELCHNLHNVLVKASDIGDKDAGAIKLYTIAYGDDANLNVLRQMAESSGGKFYEGDPATIDQIYAEIALFF